MYKKSIRPAMSIGLLITLCLIGIALFFQYYMNLEPCPLCIVQRTVFMALAVVFLIALVQAPKKWGRRIYALVLGIISALGIAVAGRQTWLQHLPEDEIPECGPGLDFWIKNLPTNEFIQKLIQSSGECAEVTWTFAGLSIPELNLIIFSLFMLYSLKLLFLGR